MKNIFRLIVTTLILASCAGPAKVEWIENPTTKQKVCTMNRSNIWSSIGPGRPNFLGNLRLEKKSGNQVTGVFEGGSSGLFSVSLLPNSSLRFEITKDNIKEEINIPYLNLNNKSSVGFTFPLVYTNWQSYVEFNFTIEQIKKIGLSDECIAILKTSGDDIPKKFTVQNYDRFKLFLDGCYGIKLLPQKDMPK